MSAARGRMRPPALWAGTRQAGTLALLEPIHDACGVKVVWADLFTAIDFISIMCVVYMGAKTYGTILT